MSFQHVGGWEVLSGRWQQFEQSPFQRSSQPRVAKLSTLLNMYIDDNLWMFFQSLVSLSYESWCTWIMFVAAALQGENLVIPSTWPMWNLASGGDGSLRWIMLNHAFIGLWLQNIENGYPKKEGHWNGERNWNHLESEVPMICRPVSSFSATTASWTYWQAIWG